VTSLTVASYLQRSVVMKTFLAPYGVALLLLCSVPMTVPAQTAKDDIKDAGRSTKRAAKDTGKATAKTAKTAGHKVKRGTKKAANKAAEKTEEGADKVRTKTN
jgi:hypothetical protein